MLGLKFVIGLVLPVSLCTAGIVPPKYYVTELHPLSGYANESINGIDNAGQVIGTSFNGDPSQPSTSIGTLWTNAAPSPINPVPFNTTSSAFAISSNGAILGISQNYYEYYNGVFSSFLYPSSEDTFLLSINSHGEVFGVSTFYPQQNLIRWNPGGATFATIATTTTDVYISGTNDVGQFIGTEQISSYPDYSDVTSNLLRFNPDGTFQQISLHSGAIAVGINDLGQVVGAAGDQAFVWTGNQLNTLISPSDTSATADSINDAGVIVGGSDGNYAPYLGYADLWMPDGTAYDLNTLLATPLSVHLDNAIAINSAGDILAYSEVSQYSNLYRYFLLTPVPEPLYLPFILAVLPLIRRPRNSSSLND